MADGINFKVLGGISITKVRFQLLPV